MIMIPTDKVTQDDNPNTVNTIDPVQSVIRLTRPFLRKNPHEDIINEAVTPPIPMLTIIAVPMPGPASKTSDVYAGSKRSNGANTPVLTKLSNINRNITLFFRM